MIADGQRLTELGVLMAAETNAACSACRVNHSAAKRRPWRRAGLAISIAVMIAQGATVKNACRAVPDDAMCAKVMRGIAQVESLNRDIGVHSDGVSHGRYGVTQAAVDELVRVRVLDRCDVDLDDPAVNAMAARLYLLLMYERAGGSWWNAVEKYHGNSDKSANSAYAAKVWAAMDGQK